MTTFADDEDEPGFLKHTIACRLRSGEHAALQPFFETFIGPYGKPSISKALRWLLNQPKVIEVMTERIAERTKRAS